MIAGMLDFADKHPVVGLANPMVTWPDGRPQPSLAKIPSFREALWEEVFWHTRLYRLTRQHYEKRSWVAGVDYRLPQSMEFLRGSCLLIRREVIDSVGVLDPTFFFGHEELDYCRRVRAAGWELMWIGDRATVVHDASAVSGKFGRELVLWKNDSKFVYWRKWRGLTAEGMLRLTTGLVAMSKWLAFKAMARRLIRSVRLSSAGSQRRASAGRSASQSGTIASSGHRLAVPREERLPGCSDQRDSVCA